VGIQPGASDSAGWSLAGVDRHAAGRRRREFNQRSQEVERLWGLGEQRLVTCLRHREFSLEAARVKTCLLEPVSRRLRSCEACPTLKTRGGFHHRDNK